jgi:hypothetical protein
MNIVAVQVGNYCGMGRAYAAALFNAVRRNVSGEHRYLCMTDDPATLPEGVEAIEPEHGLLGWWNKIALFKPGKLPEGRALYFDLDTVPIGSLNGFTAYDGAFAAMRDPFFKSHVNSSIMAWDVRSADHVWTSWERAGKPQSDLKGDQAWIESAVPRIDRWQDFLPGQIVSFKADCVPLGGVAPGVRIICFHGKPRPHEAAAPFYLPIKPAEFN